MKEYFSNKHIVGFERVCGYLQAEEWVRMVIILMLQAKKRSIQLVTIPFPCIHYLAVLPPGDEGNGNLGAQMARHIMVQIVVILDDL